jgi:hypothetical protein
MRWRNKINLLEKAGHLPEGVIESHAVDHIAVLVQGKQFLARVSIPDFAGTIVGASDEFVTAFVEGTVRQGKQMGAKHLEQSELLLLIFQLLFNKFCI